MRFNSRNLWLIPVVVMAAMGYLWRGDAVRAESPATTRAADVNIDMDRALPVAMPEIKADLSPAAYKTTDGKAGWVVRIPGAKPIATPAFAKVGERGMLFVGGGYGSHEFYAFDAASGEKVWEIKTSDDGPTAAVVEDGYVAFNTESCTVIVVDAKTGKLVWQEWLGDPLMSQPAISKGRLYMAYPAGQRHAAANGASSLQAAAPATQPATTQPAGMSHRLLCADLKTGKHLWDMPITGDVISAPIIEKDQVFFTCFDGTSFCMAADTGAVAWQKHNAGTSAPVIAGGQVVMTARSDVAGAVREGLQRMDTKGLAKDASAIAEDRAEYLKKGNAGSTGVPTTQASQLDSSVGFATAPQSANLAAASSHLNVSNVAGGWAYQGSKAAFGNGRIYNAQGGNFNCIDAGSGAMKWRGRASGKGIGQDVQIFAPPAVGAAGRNLYLCSTLGHVLSLSQENGATGFLYDFKQPMNFQPALAGGNMYATTNNGLLICLQTADADADGWTAWGGNAQHNKTEAK